MKPKPVVGFHKKYWYDMKCTYLLIAFGITTALAIVEIVKFIRI